MRRRVRAERARANDLEAEQRTVHTKLTVPSAALSIPGVCLGAVLDFMGVADQHVS